MSARGPALRDFLEATGNSLADAQRALGGPAPELPARMVISTAELELRAVVESGAGGLSIHPVTSREVAEGVIDSNLVSTLRLTFVATASETPAAAAPALARDDVIERFRNREDIRALDSILGSLVIEASFLPERSRWLVVAHDPAGRLVREILLPDEPAR